MEQIDPVADHDTEALRSSFLSKYFFFGGSGNGSAGRAVASDTRDPRFESQHREIFIYQL